MSSLIHSKLPSQAPKAVAQRTKYLTDDEWRDHVVRQDKARKQRRKGNEILKERNEAFTQRNTHGAFAKRVAFHLSRGRDAADIAIRENVPVSKVQAVINSIK